VNSGDQVDSAYQDREAAFADSSLKILILYCLQDLGCAETEAKTVMLDLEAKLKTDYYKREL